MSRCRLHAEAGQGGLQREIGIAETDQPRQPRCIDLDIAERDFWQGGCDLILERIRQAEELAKGAGAI